MAQSPYLDQNAPEILALERQKKLADLLQARALEQPQGQMVSGRYVAPSIIQQLAPLANAYMGRKAGEEVESQQSKLANLIRGQQSAEVDKFVSVATPQERLKLSLSSQNPILQGVGAKIAENEFVAQKPEWKESKKYNADGTITHGYINTKAPVPLATFVAQSDQPALTEKDKRDLANKDRDFNELSAKDLASLQNEAARLGISAKQLFFDTGFTSGGGFTPKPQAQPIAPQAPQPQAPQVSPQGLSNALRGQPTQAPVMPQAPQAQTQPLTKSQILQQNIPTDGGQLKLPLKMQYEILKEEQKPPTEFAGKAVLFGSAMNQAERVINKLEKEGTTTGAVLPSVISGIVKLAPLGVGDAAANAVEAAFRNDPTGFAGPDKNQQKLAQAQLAWSIAWLRQTSGANFGASEIASTIKEYFPLIGEDSSLVQQKNEARGARVKELEYLSGPSGAKRIQQYGQTQSTSKPLQRWNPQTQQLEDIK